MGTQNEIRGKQNGTREKNIEIREQKMKLGKKNEIRGKIWICEMAFAKKHRNKIKCCGIRHFDVLELWLSEFIDFGVWNFETGNCFWSLGFLAFGGLGFWSFGVLDFWHFFWNFELCMWSLCISGLPNLCMFMFKSFRIFVFGFYRCWGLEA
jgi:hypothetical protein